MIKKITICSTEIISDSANWCGCLEPWSIKRTKNKLTWFIISSYLEVSLSVCHHHFGSLFAVHKIAWQLIALSFSTRKLTNTFWLLCLTRCVVSILTTQFTANSILLQVMPCAFTALDTNFVRNYILSEEYRHKNLVRPVGIMINEFLVGHELRGSKEPFLSEIDIKQHVFQLFSNWEQALRE